MSDTKNKSLEEKLEFLKTEGGKKMSEKEKKEYLKGSILGRMEYEPGSFVIEEPKK
jgi:hypothetical protein